MFASKTRSILKTLSWRIVGTLDTMALGWVITGDPTVGSPVIIHPKNIVSKVPTILQLRVFKILLVLDANMILKLLD